MNALLRITLSLIGLALCVFTVMPVLRTSAWWVRVFDFPRVQITVVMVAALLAWAVVYMMGRRRKQSEAVASGPDKRWRRMAAVVPVLLPVVLGWQGYRIFPYAPWPTFRLKTPRERSEPIPSAC